MLVSSVAGKLTPTGKKVLPLRTFQEAKIMLLERAERWSKQWKAEGLKEGLKEGRRAGRAAVLKDLASQRFGELPPQAALRFDRADVDALDRWSRRLLSAKRLEDVFDEEPD